MTEVVLSGVVAWLVLSPRRLPSRLAQTATASAGRGVALGSRLRTFLGAVPVTAELSDQELAVVAVSSVALVVVFPPALVGGPVLALLVAIGRARRRTKRRAAAIERGLPEVIDLVYLGVNSGLSTRDSLEICVEWLPGVYRVVVDETLARARSGETFAESLEWAVERLGPSARVLFTVLIAAEHDGAALGPGLVRASDSARRRRRQLAEERARRLPVTMLLPLVVCVLPAFALLTVVPVLLGSLGQLSFPGS